MIEDRADAAHAPQSDASLSFVSNRQWAAAEAMACSSNSTTSLPTSKSRRSMVPPSISTRIPKRSRSVWISARVAWRAASISLVVGLPDLVCRWWRPAPFGTHGASDAADVVLHATAFAIAVKELNSMDVGMPELHRERDHRE